MDRKRMRRQVEAGLVPEPLSPPKKKRRKREVFLEMQWPCQSANDKDKPGLQATFIRYCNCEGCRKMLDAVMDPAVAVLTRKKARGQVEE